MTGRIQFTPEAEQQLHQLDEWIVERATEEVARRFVAAVLDHIDSILEFPMAGQARDDIRPGMRTTTFKKQTLIAYEVDDRSGELVVNVIGIFSGGQSWGSRVSPDQVPESS